MSCPQGLTLSGKMCTIAPILSCPSGYTLVNGMCQQDDGLQGFGDSMNIPPSGTNPIGSGEIDTPVQQPQTPTQTPTPAPSGLGLKNIVSDVGGMIAQKVNIQNQLPSMSPMMMMQQQQQQAPPPLPPSRPPSPPPPRTRLAVASPRPPPPPSRPASPARVKPTSPVQPSMQISNQPMCPAGFSLNRTDMLCYPL